MRVLIVDTCYQAFVSSHYGRHQGLAERSYDEQWSSLMSTFFGTADAYSHYLGQLGHTAHEVVVDCAPLQQAWAREHDLSTDTPAEEVLLRQLESLGPDVVYLQNLSVLSDATMRALRRSGAFVAGQIAIEPPDAERLQMYDLILTSFPHLVEQFRSLGVGAEYFRIGFDPRVADRLGHVPPERDVVFVGALNSIRHREGNRVLARAARRVPIDFFGYDLRGRSPWSPVRRRYGGERWGLDMYRVLASARIVLNRHIGAAREYANNMRLYETTGVGSLLLTDSKVNLPDLFEPGTEVITYRDANELVAQARLYLEDDEARRAVAAAGHARTMRDHTYAIRMRELADILVAHR